MFLAFFYLLRQRGLDVSLNEWMTLLEALQKGLHDSSLTGFYHLCRAIICKSETEFDRFDQVFAEFFKDVPFKGEFPDELLDWLEKPIQDLQRTFEDLLAREHTTRESLEDLLRRLEERLKVQDAEHNGGYKWVGTQGYSPWGNGGYHPGGIRVGGQSHSRTAIDVATERKYRDFRKDNRLDPRQFQMAFRMLRQLSVQSDSNDRELNVDSTIHDTCENAGVLQVRYEKPRKNTVKVLLLMDSGGSMDYHSQLCSRLFQAATKCNHFKELHTYYFHNCLDTNLYTSPRMMRDEAVPMEYILQNYDSSYKVILVGDAAMAPEELLEKRFTWGTGTYRASGMECLEQFLKQYPYLIWLNPEPTPRYENYWSWTHLHIAKHLPMYHLSTEGLEAGMKRLMVRR